MVVFDGFDGVAGDVEIQSTFGHGRNNECSHETLDRRERDGSGGDGDRVAKVDNTSILRNRRIEENGDNGTFMDLTADLGSNTNNLGFFSNYE